MTENGRTPWWQSVKVIVFLAVFVVLTGGLLALVLAGKLDCTVELVSTYVLGVVGLASALFVGRAIGSMRFRGPTCLVGLAMGGALMLLSGCGAGVGWQDVMGRLPAHASCATQCAACITALTCDQGQDQPAAAHVACAAACAACASGIAADLSGMVAQQQEEPEPAPLDPGEESCTEGEEP